MQATSSTAPSCRAELPPIAGTTPSIRVFDWVHYPHGWVATVVGFIYSANGQDYHFACDVVVTDDEIDVYGAKEVARIVDERRRQAIANIVGVRRDKRRELGISP